MSDREKLIAEAFPFDGSDPDTVIECRERARILIAVLAGPGGTGATEIENVRRESAAKALEDAADNFRYCKDYGYRATRMYATEDYLRERAAGHREGLL